MDKVWESKRYGFEIRLPEGWSVKTYDKPDDTRVAGIYDNTSQLAGIIGIDKYQGSCVDYINELMASVRKSSPVTIINQTNGPSRAKIIYTASLDDVLWQKYLFVMNINGVKMRVAFGAKKDDYEKDCSVLEKYADTLKELKPAAPVVPETITQEKDEPPVEKPRTFFGYAPVVFVLLLLGLAYVTVLWLIKGAALDIPYKAGWIVTHWSQITPDTEICSEPFCFETETTKKKAGLWRYSFCNQHSPELASSRRATIGYLIYWVCIIIFTAVLALIFGLIVMIAIQPILFLLGVSGILPVAKAFYRIKSGRDEATEKAAKLQEMIFFVVVVIGLIIMAIAWVIYLAW